MSPERDDDCRKHRQPKHITEQRRRIECLIFCSAMTCSPAGLGGQEGLHKDAHKTPRHTQRQENRAYECRGSTDNMLQSVVLSN